MFDIAIKISRQFYRHHEIHRIRSKLERDSFPRLQMMLLVSLTGASGFVASYLFLHAGLIEMWLRYLASFAVSYLVFLVLLWLWLRTRAEDYADVSVGLECPSSGSGGSGTCYSGKGGDFGGGGASGSFDMPSENLLVSGESEGMVGDALGTVAEAEEFVFRYLSRCLLALWFFRPSSCSTTWSIRPRRCSQNSWWTVCYPQASIAGYAVLKSATGWKLPSVIQRCLSPWPRPSLPLLVGRWPSMRRKLIQLARSLFTLDRAASVRATNHQTSGLRERSRLVF